MPLYDISCAYCRGWAGSFYPAYTSGLPEHCHPAEYNDEPCAIDNSGNEFCSAKCMKAFAVVKIVDDMTAEEYAESRHLDSCRCLHNGGGDCEYCTAIWDWEHNDIDWKLEAIYDT